MITWQTEKRNVSELNPAPYNPRKWPEKETKDLETSLERFNLADPIIINKNNTIIGGHFRVNIYKKHGKTCEVDCRVPSRLLTEHEERELNLRLNRNLGQWDMDALANFDEDMLKDVGFDSKELDKIFQLEDKPEADDVPEVRTTDIKRGDLFQLGKHRVLCGDSTQQADVERLMDGKKADMVFTDPPYGVSYDGTHLSSGTYFGKGQREGEKLASDDTDIYADVLPILFDSLKDDKVSAYVCFAGARGLEVYTAVSMSGFAVRALIIWNKNHAQFGSMGSQYKQKHEPILYLYKKGKSTQWFGANNEVTVWDIDRESKNKYHLTQKPVALAERAITNSSARDNIILDLFLGSGSTLIACEQTNRICFGMEIDPIYVQVIIDRFEKFTGNKAVKYEENVKNGQ